MSNKLKNKIDIPESILKICRIYNAIPIKDTYINSQLKFKMICKCGREFEKRGNDIQTENSRPHCNICSKELRKRVLSKLWHKEDILNKIRIECGNDGATYIEGTYKGCKIPFKFICRCGNGGEILWSNAIRKDRGIRCRDCQKLYFLETRLRGEDHQNYDKNISNIERMRNRSGDFQFGRDWSREVKKRADFKCVISGKNSKYLVSHHLYSWWNYPEYRIFIENGVCINKKYHNEFHIIYGKGHNTFKQFAEFFKLKTGYSFKRVDIMEKCNHEG